MYRDSCKQIEGFFVKDLSLLKHSLSRVVIVDNTSENFELHKQNGIYIKSWYYNDKDSQNDTELLKLPGLLDQLRSMADVRAGVQQCGGVIPSHLPKKSVLRLFLESKGVELGPMRIKKSN
jgi:RNA polymerase II subunit A small phosphatase-like protein